MNWQWTTLRSINYFLANNIDPDVPERVRNNYNGIARFFRAWFYFEKVKRYGDVPWIDTPLDVADSALYGGRDSRTVVMDHILEDLDFAIANITATNEGSRTLITKDVALALKARVALFEGTFRKYHPEFGLQALGGPVPERVGRRGEGRSSTAGATASTPARVSTDSYRQVFVREAPVTQEVLLTDRAEHRARRAAPGELDLHERHHRRALQLHPAVHPHLPEHRRHALHEPGGLPDDDVPGGDEEPRPRG